MSGCGGVGCRGVGPPRGLSGDECLLWLSRCCLRPALRPQLLRLERTSPTSCRSCLCEKAGRADGATGERFILGRRLPREGRLSKVGEGGTPVGVPTVSARWTRFPVSPRDPAGRSLTPEARGRQSPPSECRQGRTPRTGHPTRTPLNEHLGTGPSPRRHLRGSAVPCGPTSGGSDMAPPSLPARDPGVLPTEAQALRCGCRGVHTSPSTGGGGGGQALIRRPVFQGSDLSASQAAPGRPAAERRDRDSQAGPR